MGEREREREGKGEEERNKAKEEEGKKAPTIVQRPRAKRPKQMSH